MVKWVVIGFALFVFILLWLNIKVVVEVRVGVENSGLHIEVILLRSLLRREFTLKDLRTGFGHGEPMVEWRQKEEASRGKTLDKDWRGLASPDIRRRLMQGMMLRREFIKRRWLGRMMRSAVKVRILNWKTVVGMDDAMNTALAAGALWSFKGWILALVSCLSRLHYHRIEVVPSFGGQRIESSCHCEVLFRLAYLMIIMPMVFILFRSVSSQTVGKSTMAKHSGNA